MSDTKTKQKRIHDFSLRLDLFITSLFVLYLMFNDRIQQPTLRIITGVLVVFAMLCTTSLRRLSYIKTAEGRSDVSVTDYYLIRIGLAK